MKFKILKERLDFVLQEGIILEEQGITYAHVPHWFKIIDKENGIVEYLTKYDILRVIEMEEDDVNKLARELVLSQYGSEDHEQFAIAYNMAIITINHLLNKKL